MSETLAKPVDASALLASFGGVEPPAPRWFRDALADAPERSLVPTPRGRIETLTWGDRGKPGLLFVHGNRAHADWWSFIAPFFAGDYRVAATSLPGMGESDLRERYDYSDFEHDVPMVFAAAGLNAGPRKPVIVGHSLGASRALEFTAKRPDAVHATILIDASFGGARATAMLADREQKMAARAATAKPRVRAYPTMAAALAEFRLAPPQPCENLFIVDHIARRALKQSGEGFIWKFDPEIFDKLDRVGPMAFLATKPRIDVPLAHIWGERSFLKPETGQHSPLPAHALTIGIPEAHHHIPLDQPLALISTIRAVLAGWGV